MSVTRYMVETEIEVDEFFDPRDCGTDTVKRFKKGELVALQVTATVINLITGKKGKASLCGIQTKAHAVDFNGGTEVIRHRDQYVDLCLNEQIAEAKDQAGVA